MKLRGLERMVSSGSETFSVCFQVPECRPRCDRASDKDSMEGRRGTLRKGFRATYRSIGHRNETTDNQSLGDNIFVSYTQRDGVGVGRL